jgi:hypothetical protein
MLLRITLALAVAAASPTSAPAAQWAVGLEVTAARYWGGAHETSGERSLRPYRPTLLGVVLARSLGATSVAVHGYYGSASLALEGGDAVVAVKDALTLYGMALESSVRLATLGHDSSLLAGIAPIVERWDLSGAGAHVRAAVMASLALQVTLGEHWEGALRGEAGVGGSPFTNADLDPGFASRSLWRRQVSARVLWRL